jgi:hypothetical protein
MDWDIISNLAINILGVFMKQKNNSRKNKSVIINDVDFSELLSIVKNKKRRIKIAKNLHEINHKGFKIAIYEVQVEISNDNKTNQRYLNTICSNYTAARSTTIWKKQGNYCGQTPYAFIKNRAMWITKQNGNPLPGLKKNDAYIDAISNTPSREIPNFWAPVKRSKEICTSVILPLRLPMDTVACFGFIDFESTRSLDYSDELYKLFKEIANSFALDYLENILKEAKRNELR